MVGTLAAIAYLFGPFAIAYIIGGYWPRRARRI